MSAKRKEYPRKKTTDPAYYEDDWDNVENSLHNESYDEAVEILREGKRVGARRI
ncbi:MAG: hypothetical protein GX750_07380 [Clostridia bacterium]|nr:hypothetical protein [Clostridia bacterium]